MHPLTPRKLSSVSLFSLYLSAVALILISWRERPKRLGLNVTSSRLLDEENGRWLAFNSRLDANKCLRKAYDSLCIFESDVLYETCRENPSLWIAQLDTLRNVTEKVRRARRFVQQSDIISIGSALDTASGFCDQIVKGHTVCTDRQELDLFEFSSWLHLFEPVKNPPRVLFAEHVLEHFSPTQVQHLAAAAFLSLKSGGVCRVAVPDGYKPSPSYQQYVRAGSTASGFGNSHIVAYTVDSLVPIFTSLGFEVKLREHFDSTGKFHSETDAYADDEIYGKVQRSWKQDRRNEEGISLPWENPIGILLDDLVEGEPLYTSFWFDALKSQDCPSIWQ